VFRDGITWFTPSREETFEQYRNDTTRPWFVFRASLHITNAADLDDPRVIQVLALVGFRPDQVGQITECSRLVVPLLERAGFDGLCASMGAVRHFAVFHASQILVESREVLPSGNEDKGSLPYL
jgi:hypothetical protein